MRSFRWLLIPGVLAALGCLSDLSGTLCNPDGRCGDGYLCDRATNRCVTACSDPQVACDGACVDSCSAGGGTGGGGATGGGGGATGGGGGSFDAGVDGGVDAGFPKCPDAGMFMTTFHSPMNVVSAPSTVGWVDAGQVTVEDGLVVTTATELAPGQTTDELRVTNFGFMLPQHAEIDSITVRIKRAATGMGVGDYRVTLLRDGVPSYPFLPSQNWPATLTDTSYTVVTSGWTGDMVNSPGFGVALVAVNTGSLPAAPQVDVVSITLQARVPGQTLGPLTAAVVGGLARGLATAPWVSPSNGVSDDGQHATVSLTGGQETDWLYFDNFSLSAAQAPSGVLFELQRRAPAGVITDVAVQLAPNGVFEGAPKAAGSRWPSSDTWVRYGGVSDRWGMTTSTLANLDVGLAVVSMGGPATAEVDVGRLTVFYGTVSTNITETGVGATAPVSRPWINPTGAAVASDGQTATTQGLGPGDLTEVLFASGFGFQVPEKATIDTVDVEVTRRSTNMSLVADREVVLSVDGQPVGGNGAVPGGWSTSLTTQTYLLAGGKLSPTDVSSPGFGVRMIVQNPTSPFTDAPVVDGMRLRVRYTCQ